MMPGGRNNPCGKHPAGIETVRQAGKKECRYKKPKTSLRSLATVPLENREFSTETCQVARPPGATCCILGKGASRCLERGCSGERPFCWHQKKEIKLKIMKQKILQMALAMFVCAGARAQIVTGSNGSDGALDFSGIIYGTNIVINMSDHPNGIYQYTYVNIPSVVTVTFIPNANNTPVVWLVQGNVVINGVANVSGQGGAQSTATGGLGGPGGYRGGDGANGNSPSTAGQGPGGGNAGGGQGTYFYGNTFLIPLLGGSGGGGGNFLGATAGGGGGGGGAILIAASSSITVNGGISANGGGPGNYAGWGSGGAIRLVASQISGSGYISTEPNDPGRIRFDTYDNEFTGNVSGQFTSGLQPIIIPTAGQLPQLTVTSVGGVPVSASPTGVLSTPDAVISAQQSTPMPVVVNCANLPLGTSITVTIKPVTGSAVSAVGSNNTGTLVSSTATISINVPRGGGLIYATAATGN